ncbi:glycosyltransferase [Fusobacterium mortiferum]|uniref:Glycosyltransferase n=1 Tax=Fusobacterium mortiferum TaxID=850 RepID=A0A414PZE1_FUSMR|nr:glycosyltransferase [Fusobacterium mortiferum]RHF73887.1 glycosyltransferase [Fusobacterium mortiferum]
MEKYQPKISVIIPVYGVEKYIRQCLESIINQTYKNLEIIVVNDGTKDNSMKIVEEYLSDERIKIINKQNGGLSSARNRGIEEATGDYISFIDSDDWIDLNMYKELCSQLIDEDILIYRFFNYDNKKNEIMEEKKVDIYSKNKMIRNKYLYAGLPYSCWSKLYKREYLEKNKFKFLEIFYEDVVWNLQTIFLTEKIKFIDKKYYYYRVNRENSIMNLSEQLKIKTNTVFKEKQEYSYKIIYQNIENFLNEKEKKISDGKLLFLLLEKNYWRINVEHKILFTEIANQIKKDNRLSSEEKIILYKKFRDILQNRGLVKIEGLKLFDIFFWKNKIFTWKFLRRRIKNNF